MFRSLPRIVFLMSVVAAASQYTGIFSYHCPEDAFKCEMDKNKIELKQKDNEIATLTTLVDEQRQRMKPQIVIMIQYILLRCYAVMQT